eukprot:Gb_38557 [translate_table: standard]
MFFFSSGGRMIFKPQPSLIIGTEEWAQETREREREREREKKVFPRSFFGYKHGEESSAEYQVATKNVNTNVAVPAETFLEDQLKSCIWPIKTFMVAISRVMTRIQQLNKSSLSTAVLSTDRRQVVLPLCRRQLLVAVGCLYMHSLGKMAYRLQGLSTSTLQP